MLSNSEFLNNSKLFSLLGSMCNAACIDEASSISRCASSRSSSIFPSCFQRVRVDLSCFERLFACTLGFPRHAFLRDLQNLLNHTLGFPRHAEQNTIRTFFLPSPHFRVSCTPRAFWVTRIILSHRYKLSQHETTYFCFRRWRSRRRALLKSFRHFRLLSCGKKRMAVGTVAAGKVVSFMMSKRCNKLCHSSRVKLPLVRMSASWFLFSTYLIWTFGSRLILSDNQSRATRWVRETCLIVGLLPSITVILSHRDARSKKLDLCLIDPRSDPTLVYSWVCFGFLHQFPVCTLGLFLVFCESFPALQKPIPHTSRAQVNHPCANQHPTVWSLILWSCEILCSPKIILI